MGDIKLFAKSLKELESLIQTIRIYSYRYGIWHRKMCYAHNEERKTKNKTNNEMKRSVKSRKNQNAWTKGKLQVLGNIRSGYEKKKKKKEKSNSDE